MGECGLSRGDPVNATRDFQRHEAQRNDGRESDQSLDFEIFGNHWDIGLNFASFREHLTRWRTIVSQLPRDLAMILRSRIQTSTSGRVRELAVHVDVASVLLHGRVLSFHVKQLALIAVRELLPHVIVHNRIHVEIVVAT